MIARAQLETLLPASLLEELALTCKADAHSQVRLTGKLVFLCLPHTLPSHKNLTVRRLEETYRQYTGQHTDYSSFGKRLAALQSACFEAVFRVLFDKLAPRATEGEKRALHLRFVDAATVTLSAKRMTFSACWSEPVRPVKPAAASKV